MRLLPPLVDGIKHADIGDVGVAVVEELQDAVKGSTDQPPVALAGAAHRIYVTRTAKGQSIERFVKVIDDGLATVSGLPVTDDASFQRVLSDALGALGNFVLLVLHFLKFGNRQIPSPRLWYRHETLPHARLVALEWAVGQVITCPSPLGFFGDVGNLRLQGVMPAGVVETIFEVESCSVAVRDVEVSKKGFARVVWLAPFSVFSVVRVQRGIRREGGTVGPAIVLLRDETFTGDAGMGQAMATQSRRGDGWVRGSKIAGAVRGSVQPEVKLPMIDVTGALTLDERRAVCAALAAGVQALEEEVGLLEVALGRGSPSVGTAPRPSVAHSSGVGEKRVREEGDPCEPFRFGRLKSAACALSLIPAVMTRPPAWIGVEPEN